MIRAIVFDFGNVIGHFDHRRTIRRLTEFTALSPQEMFSAVYGTPLEDAYEKGLITSEDFVAQVHARWQLRCDQEQLRAAWSDIFEPNPDVCPLVPQLKSTYRIVLGSNTNDLHSRQFRRQFADTLRHFDGLVMSFEIGVRKPHPSFFAHCLQHARCLPAECVFIDDLPSNVDSARGCGLQGVVYQSAADLRQQLAALGILVGATPNSQG